MWVCLEDNESDSLTEREIALDGRVGHFVPGLELLLL